MLGGYDQACEGRLCKLHILGPLVTFHRQLGRTNPKGTCLDMASVLDLIVVMVGCIGSFTQNSNNITM